MNQAGLTAGLINAKGRLRPRGAAGRSQTNGRYGRNRRPEAKSAFLAHRRGLMIEDEKLTLRIAE